ncbi:SufE family protein [Marispirochaeta sp.]|uniref:SufE family protein n=1 Tax=Marispirochaeta sp. TaxID=2038653 RepID=UPI0029C6FE1D|nr:SufE family protein [Marispirochaeta sp.]
MKIKDLQEDLNLLSSWEDRLEYIIDLGKEIHPFPEAERKEEHRVTGCMSRVWVFLYWEETGGARTLRLFVDSDSSIVKGLAAILVMRYDLVQEQDIPQDCALDLFSELGFAEHLSLSRRNGLVALESRIRSFIGS